MKSKLITNLIIVIVALSLCLIAFWPLLGKGLSGIFFSIDPDVMYAANSFLFLKTGNIYYFDQPGTPAIIVMSGALFILSLYVKLFHGISFVLYSINNYDLIFYYLRILQSLILFVSLAISFVFLIKLTRKKISIVMLSLLLLIFPPFYYLGVSISAETISFLFVTLWLAAIVHTLINKNKKGVFLIFLLAGLAFAARATTFFLIPSSFLFLPILKKNKIAGNVRTLFIYSAVLLSGFAVGILPVISKVKLLIANIFSFAVASEIHGVGKKALIDFNSFSNSFNMLINSNREAAVAVTLAFLLFTYSLFLKSKDNVLRKISIIGLIFCFGILVFAKFPLAHYQTFNYYSITFLAVPLILKILKKYSVIIPIYLLIYIVPPIFESYVVSTESLIMESQSINRFADTNANNSINVWQWARSKDFALVWSRDYAPIVFDRSISNLKYPIYELVGDYKVRITNSNEKKLSDVCWDNLFIQESFREDLVLEDPSIGKYKASKIEGTPLYFITPFKEASCAGTGVN